MSFFPLDRGIVHSSLWIRGTPEALKIFQFLLLEADRSGFWAGSLLALSVRTFLPTDVVDRELKYLSSPDKESRTKADEGRRIEILDGGIRVLNYSSFRNKDYSTPRTRRWRTTHSVPHRSTKRKGTVGTVSNGGDGRELPTPTPTPTPTTDLNDGSSVNEPPLADASGGISTTRKGKSWPREASEDWDERFGYGTSPSGRIGSGLRRVVEKYGWETIRPAWQRYLAEKDAEFANPQDFAQKLMIWLDRKIPQGPAAQREARTREVLLEWLKKHEGEP